MNEFCFYVDWSGWKPEIWAAWVQAVGSVLGIAAAVAVPWWLFRKDRQHREIERTQRAKGYALTLLPSVRKLLSQVRHTEYRLSQEGAHFELYDIAELLTVPAELQQQAIIMHELGEPGSLLQDALQRTTQLASLIGDHEFYLRYGGEYHHEDTGDVEVLVEPEPYEPAIRRLKEQIATVISAMESMFQ